MLCLETVESNFEIIEVWNVGRETGSHTLLQETWGFWTPATGLRQITVKNKYDRRKDLQGFHLRVATIEVNLHFAVHSFQHSQYYSFIDFQTLHFKHICLRGGWWWEIYHGLVMFTLGHRQCHTRVWWRTGRFRISMRVMLWMCGTPCKNNSILRKCLLKWWVDRDKASSLSLSLSLS